MSDIGKIDLFLINKEKISSDWIVLDGRSVSSEDYPSLIPLISGVQGFKNEGGKITVPDLRGCFLRFSESFEDLSSRAVGSLEQDAFQDHEHRIIYKKYNYGSNTQKLKYTEIDIENQLMDEKYDWITADSLTTGHVSFGDSGNNQRVSFETRPKNISVVYAIKGK